MVLPQKFYKGKPLVRHYISGFFKDIIIPETYYDTPGKKGKQKSSKYIVEISESSQIKNPGAAWHERQAYLSEPHNNTNIYRTANLYAARESKRLGIPNPIHRRKQDKSNIMNLLVYAGVGFLIYKLVKNRT